MTSQKRDAKPTNVFYRLLAVALLVYGNQQQDNYGRYKVNNQLVAQECKCVRFHAQAMRATVVPVHC